MAFSNEELAYLATQIAAEGKSSHNHSECCPMCGYDGMWGASEGWESAEMVYELLIRALGRASGRIETLSALSELRKDANRYRWLRSFPNNVREELYAPCKLLMREEHLDAAIDAAMQQGGGGGEAAA